MKLGEGKSSFCLESSPQFLFPLRLLFAVRRSSVPISNIGFAACVSLAAKYGFILVGV